MHIQGLALKIKINGKDLPGDVLSAFLKEEQWFVHTVCFFIFPQNMPACLGESLAGEGQCPQVK